MSLFKARDWWSAVLAEGEEFDQGCLCVGDVDNTGSGYDKVVVGSYMGMLRVFAPHASHPGEGPAAGAQLLEVQMQDPIIQVEVGKFVSCSELLHLAVLHPRKLSVYAMSGVAGNVEHGDQYQLRLVYEHNLQRTACNMTFGPFGGVTGHHFICVQSMDGVLTFFEQDSYAFGRFLPAFLLPGPLCYCARTDAFITVSSTRQVECYRYETLAVAMDADTRQDLEQRGKSSGKRLTADWTLVLGEQALDICVPSTSPSATSSIFVLGERNLFCLLDNGQIRFMKKLEYSPSCFLPYASVAEGVTNLLLGNHNNMLLVYQDTTLKWAAQLNSTPVAVRVANFPELKGLVVTLSAKGHLLCSYMGTDPSFFTAPKVDAREVNYEEVDAEMKALQKVIRRATKNQGRAPAMDRAELTLQTLMFCYWVIKVPIHIPPPGTLLVCVITNPALMAGSGLGPHLT
uniref:PTHB1 N-terminal domain-containing protein n=1 Tax=Electrophorus electricus TaxID=8005 RepID=A0A4W4EW96_ELEEL